MKIPKYTVPLELKIPFLMRGKPCDGVSLNFCLEKMLILSRRPEKLSLTHDHVKHHGAKNYSRALDVVTFTWSLTTESQGRQTKKAEEEKKNER